MVFKNELKKLLTYIFLKCLKIMLVQNLADILRCGFWCYQSVRIFRTMNQYQSYYKPLRMKLMHIYVKWLQYVHSSAFICLRCSNVLGFFGATTNLKLSVQIRRKCSDWNDAHMVTNLYSLLFTLIFNINSTRISKYY